jgi:hypothetical protein
MSNPYLPDGVTDADIDALYDGGEQCLYDEECEEPRSCDRCRTCNAHCICDEIAEERMLARMEETEEPW